MSTETPVEHFFRREYAKLVAVLSRQTGVQHLEAVEDAVQSALMAALTHWADDTFPANPSAWLYRVASNYVMSDLRKHDRQTRLLGSHADELSSASAFETEQYFAGELDDDLLRMIFICCDPAISRESQLALALKILCGLDVREIALRLFASEANIYKRLERGRKRLRENSENFDERERGLTESVAYADPDRLAAVHGVLYLLFTEGHLSSHCEFSIRLELCEDALRLTHILAAHPLGATPETHALLALMHLHMARMTARQNTAGELLLLEDQDRRLWNQHRIALGLRWLARASQGDSFSRYHAEAGIAAEHCLAPSFSETRWERIVECYLLLEGAAPSPLHLLNRALALAEWKGPKTGLAVLLSCEPPAWLLGSYIWAAAMADLLQRCGHADAQHYRERALKLARNQAIQAALIRRLACPGN